MHSAWLWWSNRSSTSLTLFASLHNKGLEGRERGKNGLLNGRGVSGHARPHCAILYHAWPKIKHAGPRSPWWHCKAYHLETENNGSLGKPMVRGKARLFHLDKRWHCSDLETQAEGKALTDLTLWKSPWVLLYTSSFLQLHLYSLPLNNYFITFSWRIALVIYAISVF